MNTETKRFLIWFVLPNLTIGIIYCILFLFTAQDEDFWESSYKTLNVIAYFCFVLANLKYFHDIKLPNALKVIVILVLSATFVFILFFFNAIVSIIIEIMTGTFIYP